MRSSSILSSGAQKDLDLAGRGGAARLQDDEHSSYSGRGRCWVCWSRKMVSETLDWQVTRGQGKVCLRTDGWIKMLLIASPEIR